MFQVSNFFSLSFLSCGEYMDSHLPRLTLAYIDHVKRSLHPLLNFTNDPNCPAILLDLRNDPFVPSTLSFPALGRPHNKIDFFQLATYPPAQKLRIYHTRLPWYIDILGSQPNGITVGDLLSQLHMQLYEQIGQRHFWTEELDDSDRAGLSAAYHGRISGPRGVSEMERAKLGVMKIDFLGMEKTLMLVGFARGKNGVLEMKLKKVDM
jgi:hypothetical protein